jgi:type VI secretion system protein ImpG
VQVKLDAEFPRFTQSLMESVFPHYLAPIPSMAVVRFNPDFRQDSLLGGYPIPRGTVLRSLVGKDDRTPCKYVTAHDVAIFPIEVSEAGYHTRDLAAQDLPAKVEARAAVRIQLKAAKGKKLKDFKIDALDFYLGGVGETSMRVYEQILAHGKGVVVRPGPGDPARVLPPTSIQRRGFEPAEALLPYGPSSFQGYRQVQEYFAFPERFMFLRFSDLGETVRQCPGDTMEILVLLDTVDLELEGEINPSSFALHATPVINLFPHRADRIHVTDSRNEFHILPDRTRPLDYEVYRVLSVTGYGPRQVLVKNFLPFFSVKDVDPEGGGGAFYVTNRVPRTVSESQLERGYRLTYPGSEVNLSLVDSESSPYSADLRQLGLEILCTNRDLPLRMPLGHGKTDFVLDTPAPVQSIRCISGPTAPRPSIVEGAFTWRLISHLSLNYLSLTDEDPSKSAAALRDILRLYIESGNPGLRKQVEGVVGVSTRSIVRRVQSEGAIAFARGLEVTVKLDETGFEGTGVFLFGAVLEQFFARYITLNSFTETVIETLDRGEIVRWKPKIGHRDIL